MIDEPQTIEATGFRSRVFLALPLRYTPTLHLYRCQLFYVYHGCISLVVYAVRVHRIDSGVTLMTLKKPPICF